MVIDSATASGPGGRPAAVTASSRTVGEDADAGTGLSLVIDGVRHLQITTRPVPALKRPAQTLASRLCSDPDPPPVDSKARSTRLCGLRTEVRRTAVRAGEGHAPCLGKAYGALTVGSACNLRYKRSSTSRRNACSSGLAILGY